MSHLKKRLLFLGYDGSLHKLMLCPMFDILLEHCLKSEFSNIGQIDTTKQIHYNDYFFSSVMFSYFQKNDANKASDLIFVLC